VSEFGVYVHVPFCAHRCDYCAFATYADRDHLMDDYVDAVVKEIGWAWAPAWRPRRRCSLAAARRRGSRPMSCCDP
jgi:coproporphyrinogen III oxidase-like Fe-S oxidoreductase